MSEKIYQAISEHFARRMRNWALTMSGAGDESVISSVYSGDARGEDYGTRMPILVGEAQDTDHAMRAIPERYAGAVRLFWQYEGAALAWYGRRRAVDPRTFEAWVMDGHALLMAEIARRTDRARGLRAGLDKKILTS